MPLSFGNFLVMLVGEPPSVVDADSIVGVIDPANLPPLDVPDGSVTLAKMAALAANAIIGNNTGSPATPLALTPAQAKALLAIAAGDVSGLGTLATQSGTFSGVSSGTNTGDQTSVSGNAGTATALATGRTIAITGDLAYTSPAFNGSGNVTAVGTIPADAVTYAKMQNVAAASRLLGRGSAGGAGDVQELTLGSGLSMVGTVISATGGSDPSGYTTIVKALFTDVTNAGLTNDPDFFFSVTAGLRYMVSMDLAISGSDTTGDFTMGFRVDTGTQRGKGTCQNLTAAAAVQNIIVTAAGVQDTTAIITGAPTANLDDVVFVRIGYAFTASNTTTFRFRFGNAAAAAGRISRVWGGSLIRYKTLT